jgi:hypothetical protein
MNPVFPLFLFTQNSAVEIGAEKFQQLVSINEKIHQYSKLTEKSPDNRDLGETTVKHC